MRKVLKCSETGVRVQKTTPVIRGSSTSGLTFRGMVTEFYYLCEGLRWIWTHHHHGDTSLQAPISKTNMSKDEISHHRNTLNIPPIAVDNKCLG